MGYFVGNSQMQVYLEDWEEYDWETGTKKVVGKVKVVSPEKVVSPSGETQAMTETIINTEVPVIKRYECDVCGRIFDKAIALAGHKRGHK